MDAIQSLKFALGDHLHLDRDALHIYVALLVYLLSCVIFRWKASSFKPLFIVLIAAIAGEWFDYQSYAAGGREFDLDLHWKDFWNTIAVPAMLVAVTRFTGLFERPAKPDLERE